MSSYSKFFGGGEYNDYHHYMNTKNDKIKEQLKNIVEIKSIIFENCVIGISGRTKILDSVLKLMIVENGGIYEYMHLNKCTHIICENIAKNNQKWYKFINSVRKKIKVVTSGWVIESIKANKRLDEYQFFPVELLSKFEREYIDYYIQDTKEAEIKYERNQASTVKKENNTLQPIQSEIFMEQTPAIHELYNDKKEFFDEPSEKKKIFLEADLTPSMPIIESNLENSKTDIRNQSFDIYDDSEYTDSDSLTDLVPKDLSETEKIASNSSNVKQEKILADNLDRDCESENIRTISNDNKIDIIHDLNYIDEMYDHKDTIAIQSEIEKTPVSLNVNIQSSVKNSQNQTNIQKFLELQSNQENSLDQLNPNCRKQSPKNCKFQDLDMITSEKKKNSVDQKPKEANEHVFVTKNKKDINFTFENTDFVELFFKKSKFHFMSFHRFEFPYINKIEKFKPIQFPNITEYYNWKNELKSLNSQNCNHINNKYIWPKVRYLHVKLDCFFVAASLLYLDKNLDVHFNPIVIAYGDSNKSTSEILSCNSKAREFGIKEGMYLRDAYLRCDNLKIIPCCLDIFRNIAKEFWSILILVSKRLIPCSIDQTYIQLIDDEVYYAVFISNWIIKTMKFRTNCQTVIGIGDNVFQAKIATSFAEQQVESPIYMLPGQKNLISYTSELNNALSNNQAIPKFPENQNIMQRIADVEEILLHMNWVDIYAVRNEIIQKLNDLNIKTVEDFKRFHKPDIIKVLGNKRTQELIDWSHGLYHKTLSFKNFNDKPNKLRVCISWGIRLVNYDHLKFLIQKLIEKITTRYSNSLFKPCQLILELFITTDRTKLSSKYGGRGSCDKISNIKNLPDTNIDNKVLLDTAISIWSESFSTKVDIENIRGVNLSLRRFVEICSPVENKLFDTKQKISGKSAIETENKVSGSTLEEFKLAKLVEKNECSSINSFKSDLERQKNKKLKVITLDQFLVNDRKSYQKNPKLNGKNTDPYENSKLNANCTAKLRKLDNFGSSNIYKLKKKTKIRNLKKKDAKAKVNLYNIFESIKKKHFSEKLNLKNEFLANLQNDCRYNSSIEYSEENSKINPISSIPDAKHQKNDVYTNESVISGNLVSLNSEKKKKKFSKLHNIIFENSGNTRFKHCKTLNKSNTIKIEIIGSKKKPKKMTETYEIHANCDKKDFDYDNTHKSNGKIDKLRSIEPRKDNNDNISDYYFQFDWFAYWREELSKVQH